MSSDKDKLTHLGQVLTGDTKPVVVARELDPKVVTTYKCDECAAHYEERYRAYRCIFEHAKENFANALLDAGWDLDTINYWCGFNWQLSDKQKKITKDNCFKISYLQCCDYPAYQIVHISKEGKITVGGKGSWSGYYASEVGWHSLADPRPASELWVDKR
jgi:hypothetical protein